MKSYNFIIFFVCLFFSSVFADILSQNNEILQYLKQYPEVVRHIKGNKIYLNSHFFKIIDKGIYLNCCEEEIMLPRIYSDTNGIYLEDLGSSAPKGYDHFYCNRCKLDFSEKPSANFSRCPRCELYDQVSYRGRW